MAKRLILILISIAFFSGAVVAVELEGKMNVALVRMSHLNAEITYQEELLHTNLPGLHLAWGAEFGLVLPLGRFPLEPCIVAQVLRATMSGAGETTRASLVGLSAGGAYVRKGWKVGAAVHGYHAGLSFPLAGYEGLTGWGWGLSGHVALTFPISSNAALGLGATLQWLPVSEMRDAFGMAYLGRGAPFLDYSGIGVSASLRWKTSLF